MIHDFTYYYPVTGLNSEVERLFDKPTDENAQTVEARIRRNQIMTLTKRLQGLLIAFNDEQLTYKDKCKRKIESYLKISDNAVNEEDLEAIIEKGTLFQHTKVLMLAERDKKALYDEVKTRHEDIVKLEGSIKELHGLFVELATLIQSQSEMLNNIERNVEHAVEYAQKAHTNMIKAKNMRANVRKSILPISFISEKNMFVDGDHRLHNLHILRGDDAVLLLRTISMPLKGEDLYVASFIMA
ncbi:unnamed protein product [Onchocerca ochengi]|uniref:t-SNARE coiled-coil homology domain-containing protein n=1 Tax=Onchocerca ochengi TaxID=42157 RepID=A0A182E5Y9_ONCOC|nr:unnamed protein product [Onchocerca ochengi]